MRSVITQQRMTREVFSCAAIMAVVFTATIEKSYAREQNSELQTALQAGGGMSQLPSSVAAALKGASSTSTTLASTLKDLPKSRGVGTAKINLTIGGGGTPPKPSGDVTPGTLGKILTDLGYKPEIGSDTFYVVTHKAQDSDVHVNVGIVGEGKDQLFVIRIYLVDLGNAKELPPLTMPFVLMNNNLGFGGTHGFYIDPDSAMLMGLLFTPVNATTPELIANWIDGMSNIMVNTAGTWHPDNWNKSSTTKK